MCNRVKDCQVEWQAKMGITNRTRDEILACTVWRSRACWTCGVEYCYLSPMRPDVNGRCGPCNQSGRMSEVQERHMNRDIGPHNFRQTTFVPIDDEEIPF